MKIHILAGAIIAVAIVMLGVFGLTYFQATHYTTISSFEECQATGGAIMESYPEQCKSQDGQLFVKSINNQTGLFGQTFTIRINEKTVFDDGLSITLIAIDDSQCKPGVTCIWAGELSAVFSLTGGEIGAISQQIRLGYATNPELEKGNYAFALQNATEGTATMVVNKKMTAAVPVPTTLIKN